MPIRLRLALGGVAVAGLALLVFGVLFDRLAAVSMPAEQDKQLSELARQAVESISVVPGDALATGLSPVATDPSSGDDPFVAIVAEDASILFSSARLIGVVESIASRTLTRASEAGSAVVTVTPEGGPELRLHIRPWDRPDLGMSGFVIAGQATSFAEQQVVGFRAVLIVTGVIALIGAAAASWFVSGRALRPLRTLAATAEEIGRTGDLTRRLPPARSGDVLGVLTASFDGMLERLGAARQRLAEALESQRRFVADASHELRGPLTSIGSNAGFLLEHPGANESDRSEALADIATEVDRMGRLVDGLLTLARADAGQALEWARVDLGPIAEDVVRRSRHLGRPILLEVGDPVGVTGDRDALSRLIWILVDNAGLHGEGDVELRIVRNDRGVVLEVADRGPGLPVADIGRIFERFYRADPSRSIGGAGLGLSIARWIVEAHGGSITARNREGGGAVFRVELPTLVELPPAPAPPWAGELPPVPTPPEATR